MGSDGGPQGPIRRKIRPLGDPVAHLWRVQRMAKAVDADLVAARQSGALSAEDWAGMVTRCRRCRWAEGCDRWLGSPTCATRDAPDDCLNRDVLTALSQAQAG